MTMRPPLEEKTPEEVKDYGLDWSKYLDASVTITGSTWGASSPAGLTVGTDAIFGQATVVRLSAGAAGTRYTLVNTITTSASETLARALEVSVRTAAQIAGI